MWHRISDEQVVALRAEYAQGGVTYRAMAERLGVSPNSVWIALTRRESPDVRISRRFWSRVSRQADDDCWEWNGARSSAGYGQIRTREGLFYAHRMAWALTHGPVPIGMWVLHACDNPCCCNPSHLFLGNQKENMRDCCRKGRHYGDTSGAIRASAKLKEMNVRDIRAQWRAGNTRQKQLAAEYGVSVSAIKKVVNRVTWRDVPPL